MDPAGRAADHGPRCLQAPQVAVRVGPRLDGHVPETLHDGTEHVGLRRRRPRAGARRPAQGARGLGDDPLQEPGPVGTAVVVGGVLEGERVAGEQAQRRRGDVGHDGDHHIGPALQLGRHGCEEVTGVGFDAVAPRAQADGAPVDVGGDDAGIGLGHAGGPWRGRPIRCTRRSALPRAGSRAAERCANVMLCQRGTSDAGVDPHVDAVEGRATREPGQGLAGQAPLDERVQRGGLTTGCLDELACLVLRGDEPCSGEDGRQPARVRDAFAALVRAAQSAQSRIAPATRGTGSAPVPAWLGRNSVGTKAIRIASTMVVSRIDMIEPRTTTAEVRRSSGVSVKVGAPRAIE